MYDTCKGTNNLSCVLIVVFRDQCDPSLGRNFSAGAGTDNLILNDAIIQQSLILT